MLCVLIFFLIGNCGENFVWMFELCALNSFYGRDRELGRYCMVMYCRFVGMLIV